MYKNGSLQQTGAATGSGGSESGDKGVEASRRRGVEASRIWLGPPVEGEDLATTM
jgi:hypothetical protein